MYGSTYAAFTTEPVDGCLRNLIIGVKRYGYLTIRYVLQYRGQDTISSEVEKTRSLGTDVPWAIMYSLAFFGFNITARCQTLKTVL